ncbi:hypothetical protein RIF29_19332 [Crotalaria pallida]|uniref:Uncharacterized protein n=1 Tax=Crotalaria pallida TaxID=3830 RepID=A0AAN9EZT0_CROPI
MAKREASNAMELTRLRFMFSRHHHRSDVLGQFMPLVGVDWSQTGVTHLFTAIKVRFSCQCDNVVKS